ncbi:MAG: response regulator, partial [Clostridiales bacterium]|nr:response regulator [Clostridiales bacterium]
MQIAIVEDLDSDFDLLAKRIRENCSINKENAEISRFRNAEEFLNGFRPGLYQAVFFDIILGGQTGIDAAWKVREADTHIPIIFTTTETGFSLESYGIHALDYLVKPVSSRALGWCMERLRESISTPAFIEIREIGKNSGAASRLIFLDELVFAESIRNGILLHTSEGEVQSR